MCRLKFEEAASFRKIRVENMCVMPTHTHTANMYFIKCKTTVLSKERKIKKRYQIIYLIYTKFMRLVESINHIMSAEEGIWYNIDRSQKIKQRIQPFYWSY